MAENKFERIEREDDPDRCQGVGQHGQCPFKRTPPSKFCPRHGGNKAAESAAKEAIRNYQLTKYKARIDQFADNPKVKDLREEIAILRMCLETVVNRCNDANDLMLSSNKISDLVMKIDKIVVSCHKLEASTGQLLDRQAALNFASEIVKIVANHVEDSEIVATISEEILQALGTLQGKQGEEQ